MILFASGVVAILNDFFVLLCLVFVLIHYDLKLALATLSPLPLMLITTLIFRTQVRDANRRIRTAIARINAFLQEHITGMSVVQLFNRERKSRREFEKLNRVHMDAYKDAINAFAYFYPAVEFLSVAAIALVFWYGGMPRHQRHACGELARRIYDVGAAIFPPDPGPQRQIQYPANGDGRV